MTYGYLYKDFITRRIRFRDVASFMSKNLSLKYDTTKTVKIIIDGCQVTGASPFVDIQYPHTAGDTMPDKVTWLYSYVSFYNEVEGTEYFAFIDRIEPNNFNKGDYEGASYRLFITIDWWTMMLVNQNEKLEKALQVLEGETVRAHIRDIERSINSYRLFPYYTTPIAEIEAVYRTELIWKNASTFDDEIRYEVGCVIIKSTDNVSYEYDNDTDVRYYEDSAEIKNIANPVVPSIATPIKTYIVPFINGIGSFINKHGLNAITLTFNFGSETIVSTMASSPFIITDRSVVEMSIVRGLPKGTTFTPEYGFVIPCHPRHDIRGEKINFEFPKFEVSTGNELQETAHCKGCPLNYVDFDEFNFDIPRYSLVSIPRSYNDYISTCIAKLWFTPYLTYELRHQNDTVSLPYEFANNEYNVSITILPDYSGGYYVGFDNNLAQVYGKWTKTNQYKYKPAYIYDSTTVTRFALENVSTFVGGISSSINAGYSLPNDPAIEKYNYSSSFNLAGDLAQRAIKMDRLSVNNEALRLTGETGFGDISNNVDLNMYTLYCVKKTLSTESYDIVAKDLALYGYNTYLHPHELFKPDHKRKYFNYIKTRGANLNATGIVLDIRLHIEEMFNNGVWLWNTDEEFGNFEVPNYLLIMEE